MRLSIKYLLGCLALLFLLPACKGNDEIEEATLDLSTETLTFAKEGSEQSVTVSTNKESWLAFSTQEAWLSVEQQGSTLKVKAEANEQGRDRAPLSSSMQAGYRSVSPSSSLRQISFWSSANRLYPSPSLVGRRR